MTLTDFFWINFSTNFSFCCIDQVMPKICYLKKVFDTFLLAHIYARTCIIRQSNFHSITNVVLPAERSLIFANKAQKIKRTKNHFFTSAKIQNGFPQTNLKTITFSFRVILGPTIVFAVFSLDQMTQKLYEQPLWIVPLSIEYRKTCLWLKDAKLVIFCVN